MTNHGGYKLLDGQGMKGHNHGLCKRCGKTHGINRTVEVLCFNCGSVKNVPLSRKKSKHIFCSYICKYNWQSLNNKGKPSPSPQHRIEVKNQIHVLEEQGFRCIPNDSKPRPDIIAIKDGKVYAVEVEFHRPNYDKYKEIKFFDDIIWVIKKE